VQLLIYRRRRRQIFCFHYKGNLFSMAQKSLVGKGLLIIEASRSHSDTPHSVWHLWTGDQPDVKTSTWKHTTFKTDIYAPGRIRTRNPSKRAAAGICFKNICQTKTRITQNCTHVHLVQPVFCYRFSGSLLFYILTHNSISNLLYYRLTHWGRGHLNCLNARSRGF
jgi:hypothetical protein